MKKALSTGIACIVGAVAITASCGHASSVLDKYLGEWKRIDQPEKHHYTIKLADGAIIGITGSDTCAALYDRHAGVLKFYVLGQPGVVTYVKKSGHLLLNKGRDGEFERVRN